MYLARQSTETTREERDRQRDRDIARDKENEMRKKQ